MNAIPLLPEEDLELLQQMIDLLPPGRYQLPEILGASWKYLSSPTLFGQQFKQAVRWGRLQGIRLVQVKPGHRTIYIVSAESPPKASATHDRPGPAAMPG